MIRQRTRGWVRTVQEEKKKLSLCSCRGAGRYRTAWLLPREQGCPGTEAFPASSWERKRWHHKRGERREDPLCFESIPAGRYVLRAVTESVSSLLLIPTQLSDPLRLREVLSTSITGRANELLPRWLNCLVGCCCGAREKMPCGYRPGVPKASRGRLLPGQCALQAQNTAAPNSPTQARRNIFHLFTYVQELL